MKRRDLTVGNDVLYYVQCYLISTSTDSSNLDSTLLLRCPIIVYLMNVVGFIVVVME